MAEGKLEAKLVWFVALVAVIRTARTESDREVIQKWCEMPREVQTCPPPMRGTSCHCVFSNDSTSALCCHVNMRRLADELADCARGPPVHLKALFLSNCTSDNNHLNLSLLAKALPALETFSVGDGQIKAIAEEEPQFWNVNFKNLTCLNLSQNSLVVGRGLHSLLNNLESLRVVDLSFNELITSPHVANRTKPLWLHLAGNKLRCDGIREMMQKKVNDHTIIHFLYMAQTSCDAQNSFQWFNSTDPINLLQIEATEKIIEDCPEGREYKCKCKINRLMYNVNSSDSSVDRQERYFTVSVDCSHLQLTELPKKLPRHTNTLNVSYNYISSLEPIISKDKNYEGLKILDADFNNISSIQILEGSMFLKHFETFRLRGNNLTSLTTHFLSHSFERNWFSLYVYLGQNKFRCDCSTAQTLKVWLIKNKKHIPDHDELLCEDAIQTVLFLDEKKVCLAPAEEWTDYIYYIIAAEVLLLMLLVGKVSYDYWVFKNVGYLPWPASKMPKLPCDCVLET